MITLSPLQTGLGIVVEVDNRDAKTISWSVHAVGLIVPLLLINIKFEDGGNGATVWVVTTL